MTFKHKDFLGCTIYGSLRLGVGQFRVYSIGSISIQNGTIHFFPPIRLNQDKLLVNISHYK